MIGHMDRPRTFPIFDEYANIGKVFFISKSRNIAVILKKRFFLSENMFYNIILKGVFLLRHSDFICKRFNY